MGNLVCLLVDLIVLVRLGLEKTSSSLNVEQDVGEGPHGVRVPPHHHVGKADIVVHCNLAARDARVQALLVQLDVFQNLKNWVFNILR